MTVAAHPKLDTLAAYARGDLPAPDRAGVAGHVGGCPECCAALGRLLRGAPAGPLTPGADPDPAGPPALTDHPRYRVLGELGVGGMGVVYKAEHRIMGRVVALKVMAPQLTAKAGSAERFRKEVRAAARLAHPNIVTAHDADEAGGLHFLVMEYVDGVSLDRLVARRGPLPVAAACALARQAALGLGHAHALGMVHRDIKPQNLMVTRKGHLKVMDFGLARFVREGVEADGAGPPGRLPFGAGKPVADPLTNPNLLMGTPDYLSPEQARNSTAVDHRADLYSLGCTLYFLLTGKAPFAAAESLIDKLLAHTEEPPPAVRAARPDVPEGLAAVARRLLAKDPDARPGSAAEVAAALAPYLRPGDPDGGRGDVELVVEAAPKAGRTRAADGLTDGTVPTGPTLAEVPRPRPRRKKVARAWRTRRGWGRAWAAAAVAVVLVVAAVVVGGRKKPAAPAPADPPLAAAAPVPAPPAKPEPAPPAKPKPVPDPAARARDVLPLLLVVPSDGLSGPDYFPVRDRAAEAGVKVVTASGAGGSAALLAPHDDGAKAVRVDLRLADADAGRFSAAVFCGDRVDEYVVPGLKGYGPPARHLLAELRAAGKPVGAVGLGQRVLVAHGALKGRTAARCDALLDNFPGVGFAGVTWADKPLYVDGRVVTAAGPAHAEAFADALLKLVTAD
jgi:serine/threonine-protein kinase